MKLPGFIFALLFFLGAASSAALEITSRFQKITLALQNDSEAIADLFAQSALTILMEVYLAEADLAKREDKELAGDHKLAAWARAVEQYANQLSVMLEQISSGSAVKIGQASNSLTVVAIEGRQIILSHPRADQQLAFEHRIVSDLCARLSCDTLFEKVEAASPVPVSAPVFTPDWSFAATGPACSSHAIRIRFSSAADLASSRSLCKQFFQEISSLATEIKWQSRQGVVTQWESVAIRQTPNKPEHIVTLTLSGDVTLLPLPLLFSSKGLLMTLVPWLKAEVASLATPALLLDAQDYGWNQR